MKCVNIIKHVIAPCHQKTLANKIRIKKIGIKIDQATNLSKDHCLRICIRYFDDDTGKFTESLLDMIIIYKNEEDLATGLNLYNKMIACLKRLDIPVENIIVF